MESVEGKKVYVGLSGGVDSAVTAALLKRAGANVTGAFIKGWYPPGMPCTWSADRRDAMRVAAKLQIPFATLDASAEYKSAVIDYLVEEYRQGRTPNPDVMCNREVKFGAFYRYAREDGADFIATGHYARIKDGKMRRARDESKDQSYFLWAVPKAALSHTVFPLGEFLKSEVRSLARRLGLPVADKPDSQGICFLGEISIDAFLRDEFENVPGTAVAPDGSAIGTHDGALLYTLGERVALKGAPPGPWYVVSKDIGANTLAVSRELRQSVPQSLTLSLTDANWLEPVDARMRYVAQYRYHGPRVEVAVTESSVTLLDAPPDIPACGQSLVIYGGDTVIGGGIIA